MTPFGLTVASHAVFWLDKNRKRLEWFSEDWPLTSLVSPIVDLACSCFLVNLLSRFIGQNSLLLDGLCGRSSLFGSFFSFPCFWYLTFLPYYFPNAFRTWPFTFMFHSCAKSLKHERRILYELSPIVKRKHLFIRNENNWSRKNCQLNVSVYQCHTSQAVFSDETVDRRLIYRTYGDCLRSF